MGPGHDSLTGVSSFPLAPLSMNAILGEITLTQRRKKLGDMTNGGVAWKMPTG